MYLFNLFNCIYCNYNNDNDDINTEIELLPSILRKNNENYDW